MAIPHYGVLRGRAIREIEPPLRHHQKGRARIFVGRASGQLQAIECGSAKLIRTIWHRLSPAAPIKHKY